MVEVPVDLNSLLTGNRVRASRRRVPQELHPGDAVLARDEADVDAYYAATVIEVGDKSLMLRVDMSERSLPQRAA